MTRMRLFRGQPYWLDNATRDRGLAIMSFEDGAAVVALMDRGVNTARTVAVGDRLDVEGVTWTVTEIVPDDSVLLEETP
ncbi:DUF6406 domain-containing protein [Thermoactinospora rubra]|uniref:DUF6406 domain-containing protein n=1 Tax=Thermoactinospora rubra TaxID=1088767 RepID=UPI00117F7C2B|nr:DUF6406 domain-containing protein [Thermoactinospora rubra]